jgi:hypothetical protein
LQNLGTMGANAAAGSGQIGQTAATAAGGAWQNAGLATSAGYMGAANAFGGNNGVFQNAINAYQLANPGNSDTYVGAYSDRRLKDDVVRVGTLDSGLPVYLYRFKGSLLPQMGVMADEVKRVAPHAVHRDPSTGFDKVNYRAVSLLPKFKEAA